MQVVKNNKLNLKKSNGTELNNTGKKKDSLLARLRNKMEATSMDQNSENLGSRELTRYKHMTSTRKVQVNTNARVMLYMR